MRFTLSTSLLVPLALSVAAAPSLNAKSYDGYKVFRVKTHGDESSIEERLSTLSYE